MFQFRNLLGLLIVIFWTCAAAQEASVLDDWLIERSQQTVNLDERQAVFIENDHGGVRVRTANDDSISIVAVTQRHVSDDQVPAVRVLSEPSALKIWIEYPETAAGGSVAESVSIAQRRMDIALLVPKGADLHIRTLHDLAETKGHKGNIQVQTRTGAINIKSKGGLVVASSQRGRVTVAFAAKSWRGDSHIETHTGDIQVSFIGEPDLAMTIDTSGDITTDYSLNIEPFPGSTRKQAVLKSGQASRKVDVKSKRGDVRISRIPEMIDTNQTSGNDN